MNYQAAEFLVKALKPSWEADEIYDMSARSFLALLAAKRSYKDGDSFDEMTEEEQRMFLLFMCEFYASEQS